MNIDKGICLRFKKVQENDEVYITTPTQQESETWTLSRSEQELMYPEEETGEEKEALKSVKSIKKKKCQPCKKLRKILTLKNYKEMSREYLLKTSELLPIVG